MVETSLTETLLRQDRKILLAALAVMVLLAALYTIFGMGMDMTALKMTAMGGMTDMPGLRAPGRWPLGYGILVFLMWWVMMVAMMLPSAAPTILLYARLARTGSMRHVRWIAFVFLGGYLMAWAGFSVAAVALQWGLERMGVISASMMTLMNPWMASTVLLAAGLYQLTPLKHMCLDHCRSPMQFIVERRRPGLGGAALMGMEHGAFCLGCCWFLMALLFVGGVMNLYWIVGLNGLVAAEKLVPWGALVSRFSGIGMIVLAGSILVAGGT